MSLKYHAPTDSFVLSSDTLKLASAHIRGAMKSIRVLAGLPLDRYQSESPLTPADLAQQRLVALARDLGIDLGSEWANQLDLRD